MTHIIHEYLGHLDLAGRRFGTLYVVRLAGRNPLRWLVKCERCGATATERHVLLVAGGARCRNSACGRTVPNSGTSVAKVIPHEEAARSRDSESAARFRHQQREGNDCA